MSWNPPAFVAATLLSTALAVSQAGKHAIDLTLVHYNDFHGQVEPYGGEGGLGGIAVLSTFVAQVRAQSRRDGGRVVVTDAGDWFQGTPEGNETRGLLPIELLSELGVGVAVLGNHEFDYGVDSLARLIAATRYPVLGANITRGRTGRGFARPYHVIAVRGLRVGILGLTTSETRTTSTGPFADLEFGNEIEAVERWLPRLLSDCDTVVLLTHTGVGTDRRLAQRFPQVSGILGGHSHTSLPRPLVVGTTWIVQTGGKSQEVYRIDLHVDPVGRRLELVDARKLALDPARFPPDPEVAAELRRRSRAIRARWDKPLGHAAGTFGRPRSFGSTPAGNLIAELIRKRARAAIGIHNKGGIRTELRAGPLTRRMIFEMLPFQNHVVAMDLSGAELRQVLQEGLARGRPFEVAGIRYDVEVSAQSARVGDIRLATGNLVQPEKRYRVATNSFLAGGGDGASTLRSGRNREGFRDLLRDLLEQEVQARGTLVPDPDARIRVREK